MNYIEVINMPWSEFVKRVKNDNYNSLNDRLAVLNGIENFFKNYDNFQSTPKKIRKCIAGFIEEQHINWLWFGSMRGSGKFKNKINSNDKYISYALDEIPLNGKIEKKHFENYIRNFMKALPNWNWIATSTRLLAMKRPDVFVCINSKNRKKLCKEFGITQSNITYQRYWNEIISKIFDSKWWKVPRPKNKDEYQIWKSRGAFLDSLYYIE